MRAEVLLMTATTTAQPAAAPAVDQPEAGEDAHMLPHSARYETRLFECISCESTNLTRAADLAKEGWAEYEIPGEVVVLCGECKATYAERRRIREAMSWSDDDA